MTESTKVLGCKPIMYLTGVEIDFTNIEGEWKEAEVKGDTACPGCGDPMEVNVIGGGGREGLLAFCVTCKKHYTFEGHYKHEEEKT